MSHSVLSDTTVLEARPKVQSDHLSGKPGNVREFETCQRNVRDNVNSQGIVREESGKNYCQGKLASLGGVK